jgi:uncharacterized Zn finger protein
MSFQLNPDSQRIVSYCPLCETEFNPMEARVLDESAEASLVHVRCKECRNAMLTLVLMTKAGVSSVGLVTDLSYDDVVKFKEGSGISVDDVMGAHQGLKNGGILRDLQGN